MTYGAIGDWLFILASRFITYVRDMIFRVSNRQSCTRNGQGKDSTRGPRLELLVLFHRTTRGTIQGPTQRIYKYKVQFTYNKPKAIVLSCIVQRVPNSVIYSSHQPEDPKVTKITRLLKPQNRQPNIEADPCQSIIVWGMLRSRARGGLVYCSIESVMDTKEDGRQQPCPTGLLC